VAAFVLSFVDYTLFAKQLAALSAAYANPTRKRLVLSVIVSVWR
jgi:hypothetical protein